MLFSFRQNISAFCLQNSDSIGGFPIRPAWDAYGLTSTDATFSHHILGDYPRNCPINIIKERDIAIGYAPFLIYNGQTLRHYYFWRKIPIPYMSILLRQ